MFCKFHKINLNCDISYTDSLLFKEQKATINPKNNDMCVKYEVTFGLNDSDIGKHSERIRKITPFKDQCEWKKTRFPTGSKDWKKFETSKKTIVLNVFFLPSKSDGIEKMKQAYILKHTSE